MLKYGFYLTSLFLYKDRIYNSVLIREYTVRENPYPSIFLCRATDFVLNKVLRGFTVKNFGKCLKIPLNGCFLNQHSKWFLCSFLLKNRITKKQFVCGDASLCSAPVLLVVKFYREIFYKICFSNTSRWLLLKLPRNNQLFLIQSQVAEHHCMSFYEICSNFSCVLLLSSVLIFSVLFSPDFCRDEVKVFFDIH